MSRPRRKRKEDVYQLLAKWQLAGATPGCNDGLSSEIWDELGTQRAVLITDLSGFTRITRSHGLLQFLAVFERAQQIGRTMIERHGGRFLKADADNLFALFDTAGAAGACAQTLLHETAKHNAQVADPAGHVRFCIGIAFGRVLELDDDAFGDPVNIAFKLGEDVAEAGEILVAGEAADDLRASRTHHDLATSLQGPLSVTVGGVNVGYWKLPPRP